MNSNYVKAYLSFGKSIAIIGLGISLSTILHHILWKVQFAYHWYAYSILMLLFLWSFYRFYTLKLSIQMVEQKVWISIWTSFALLLFCSVSFLLSNHYTLGFSMATIIIGAYGFLQGALLQKKSFKLLGLMGLFLGIIGVFLNFKTALLLLAFCSAANLIYPGFTKIFAEEKA